MNAGPPTSRAPSIAWDWGSALTGAVYAVPAALVAPHHVSAGLALGFGVFPAAIIGVAPTRRERAHVVVVGALTGIPIFVGSLLAGVPWLAVPAIAALAIGSALLSTRRAIGQVVMTLSLPMVGVGLSYSDIGEGAGLAGLIVAGSVYACLVSLAWPERPPPLAVASPSTLPTAMLGYGIRLALAGSTAAAIGFAFDFDHVGWACAAALLVMRPSEDMQRLRSAGRPIAVAAGALAAALVRHLTERAWVYGVAVMAVLVGAAATRRSRWYVTPFFTTFITISLLIYSDPKSATSRFNERVGETLLGVGIAYFFGLVVPGVLAGVSRKRLSAGRTR